MAAHISAASPGGARYDEALTPEERSSIGNGIWLCQQHGKLIDDDELTYTVALLRDWKETSEHMAALEARGYAVRRASPYPDLERKAPALFAEMRNDLKDKPLTRQLILLERDVTYNAGSTPFFVYYYEDHPSLDSLMTIMVHAKAIYEITFNSVPRFNLNEDFVEYLLS